MRLFYSLLLLATLIFLWGIKPDFLKNPIFILALPLALTCVFTNIISYQNVPILLFMLFVGLFYLAMNAMQNWLKVLLFVLASGFLFYSGFANVSLFPAEVVAFLAFAIVYRQQKLIGWFIVSYLFISTACLSAYIIYVGFYAFFDVHRAGQVQDSLYKMRLVTLYIGKWYVLFILLRLLIAGLFWCLRKISFVFSAILRKHITAFSFDNHSIADECYHSLYCTCIIYSAY